MKSGKNSSRRDKIAKTVYKSIDFLLAGLLLSGQITATAVWLTRDSGFGISFTGDITGDTRTVNVDGSPSANVGIDFINVITALLLISGEVHLVGIYIGGAGIYNFVISGPPFGFLSLEAYAPTAKEFFADFRENVFQNFPPTKRS
ncbi:hypothetical protein NZD89_18140 [Alicyclobacillus fastidiosus]|uniref:Uncharacterized protein n=1 Tax=Alicyclobacillus fastidiosus TaxID=392011 RepID=A0ABY6ZDS0_9BACL|nr:hypothetical protein [Alicyclobacillus fastidiosus]WAH40280.1 hypothetical protein NZD89_18140 [Alicyclobacillus fastidiosus]GMA61657.1 hypothetical protein GCM10025859_20970 [Alicyclobacillus fastidiosus]